MVSPLSLHRLLSLFFRTLLQIIHTARAHGLVHARVRAQARARDRAIYEQRSAATAAGIDSLREQVEQKQGQEQRATSNEQREKEKEQQ